MKRTKSNEISQEAQDAVWQKLDEMMSDLSHQHGVEASRGVDMSEYSSDDNDELIRLTDDMLARKNFDSTFSLLQKVAKFDLKAEPFYSSTLGELMDDFYIQLVSLFDQDVWYDKKTRSWVQQLKFNGNQVGEASYTHTKPQDTLEQLVKKYL